MEPRHDDLPDSSTSDAPTNDANSSSLPELVVLPSAWEQIRSILLKKLGQDNFSRCFSGTSAVITDDRRVILNVPNPIHQLWIESNHSATLNDAIAEVLGTVVKVEFGITAADAQHARPFITEEQPKAKAALGINHRHHGDEVITAPRVTEAVPVRSFSEAGLNPKFSFDSFVVGSNSSYSAAVAHAVAEKPGRIYNPLFFYGATGLGKTHLMQAIGQEVLLRKKKAVVRYVTSEQFTNEFVDAIKKQSFTQFRQKYRKVDCLLIDDVHFFAGKDSTQEEFFHTFNELFNNAKQIVLASDRPPSEIKNLESRLVSRFEWGLTTQIQMPDFETRVAILRRKQSDFDGVELEPWILEFMAQRIRTNVRKLEGALMRVAAHFSLTRTKMTEAELAAFLHDVIDDEPAKSVTVDRVQRVVATHYDLRVSDLTGPRRPKNIAEARQIAMYLTRHMVKLPLIQIGDEFGGRDHGTVIHACKVVTQRISKADEFRQTIDHLTSKILEA